MSFDGYLVGANELCNDGAPIVPLFNQFPATLDQLLLIAGPTDDWQRHGDQVDRVVLSRRVDAGRRVWTFELAQVLAGGPVVTLQAGDRIELSPADPASGQILSQP